MAEEIPTTAEHQTVPGSAPENQPSTSPLAAPPVDPFAAMSAVNPTAAEGLRREWGGEYEANIEFAKNAANALADPELVALLNETGLGDDPRLVRVAARIGQLLSTPDPGASSQAASSSAPSDAGSRLIEAEIERLMERGDYWSDAVQSRVRHLYLTLHGSEPIGVHRNPGEVAQRW